MLCYAKKLLNNGQECVFRSPVGIRDASSLLALNDRLLSETGYLQPVSERVADAGTEAAMLDLAADSSDLLILVAEKAGRFIGSACLMRSGNEKDAFGEIGVAVIKEEWGRGVGSHLLRILIRKAEAAGYTRLHLAVKQDNIRAQRLYLKFGFAAINETSSSLQPVEMILDIRKAGQESILSRI